MLTGFDASVHVIVAAAALILLLRVRLRHGETGVAPFTAVALLLVAWSGLAIGHATLATETLTAASTRALVALGAVAPLVWLTLVARAATHRTVAPLTLRLLALPAVAFAIAALAAPLDGSAMLAGAWPLPLTGLAFWAGSVPYSVLLLAFGTLLLVDAGVHGGQVERLRSLLLTLAGAAIGGSVLLHAPSGVAGASAAAPAALGGAILLLWLALAVSGDRGRPAVAFREVFFAMNEAAMVVAPDGTVLEANAAASALLAEREPRDKSLLSIAPQLELARRSVSGRQGTVAMRGDYEGYEVSVANLRDARQRWRGSVLVVHDERRGREQARRLREDSFRDALTGIANRRGFEADVAEALAAHHGEPIGIAFIDLDGFKAVNDTLGHGAGDVVLMTVARRLEHVLRDGDTVARIGGDEFALLLPGITPGGLAGIPARIADQLGRPILHEGRQVSVGASVGLASAPRDGTTADALLEASDERMYRQKRGKCERSPELSATASATV